jgi:endoglucanase
MNRRTRWSSLLSVTISLAAIACGPSFKGSKLEQTAEGHPCPASALVDDGEDNNNQVMVQDNRSGYWYTYVDKQGSTIDPPAGEMGGTFRFNQGGVNGSAYGARMSGSVGNSSVVYAGMGLSFTDPKSGYDASKYGGISFWAKKGAQSTRKVRLKIPDSATDPEGEICSACFNDFGIDLKLTEEWTKYILPFDDMRQERGWGTPHPSGIDKTKIFGLQFQVNDKGKPYDIWVDELGFTGCAGEAAGMSRSRG